MDQAIEKYLNSFEKVLYEDDEQFLEGMKTKSLANDDIRKYQYWEWTQGVGLYGVWKLYQETKNPRYLEILTSYYERQMAVGLPAKNVNTTTPLLAMSFVAEELGKEDYLEICREWADWICSDFPRTREDGLQHITSDTVNEGELWDDTLFMTVLFLANMGRIMGEQRYLEEAEYQFLIHVKYLADKKTGLWYHGWTFKENHNFKMFEVMKEEVNLAKNLFLPFKLKKSYIYETAENVIESCFEDVKDQFVEKAKQKALENCTDYAKMKEEFYTTKQLAGVTVVNFCIVTEEAIGWNLLE